MISVAVERASSQVALSSSNRLNMDFLTVLADCATAALHMTAPSQGSSVEAVLKFLAVLGFPGFDWHSELLLDTVSVPFWDDIK